MNREDNTSVYSNQSSIHDDLAKLVQKHMTSTWQEPTPPHDREAMREIVACLRPTMDRSFWTLFVEQA